MSSKSTTNYQLNQWEPTDPVLRTDFNEDNAKIDAALGTIPKIACGTYTGDGAESRTISLGFTPKAVLVTNKSGSMNESGVVRGGLAVTGSPVTESYGSETVTALAVTTGGFQVAHQSISYRSAATNSSGATYHYVAIG